MKLCVMIPAKDEARVIGGTIQSLLDAGIAPQDVYVVDDGSSDGTGGIAAALGARVLRNESNIGKAHSVKRGADHFLLTRRYDAVALMDADSRVDRRCYEHVKVAFENPGVAMVCSRTRNYKHNWLTAYRGLVYYLANEIYRKGQHAMGVITVVPGFAATYRADVFDRLSWDNDTVTEDMDTTVQVHKRKLGKIVFANDAVAYTQDPQTLHDYVKQMMRWYTGAWQVAAKHGMWGGNSKIDWEFKLLLGEAVVFSVWVFTLPFLAVVRPQWAVWAYGVESTILLLTSLLCAVMERRLDVFAYAFIYPFLRMVDCAIVLRTFWKITVRRQHVSGWFAPVRY